MALRLAARQSRLVVFGYNAVTSRIEWVSGPSKQHYVGDFLDLTGCSLIAYYKDGTTSDITDSCTFDPSGGSYLKDGGEQTLTAFYTDHAGNQFSSDYPMLVAQVDRLVVTGPSTQHYAGDTLDLTGSTVTAYYTDGSTKDITDLCTFEPASGTKLEYGGEQALTASYTDPVGNQYTGDGTIFVADVEMLVFSKMDVTQQKEGEPLDLTGIWYYVHYTDGTNRKVEIPTMTIEPAAGTIIGHQNPLTIQGTWVNPATGSEYSTDYDLTIDMIDKIYWESKPDKLSYSDGEPLDLTGKAIYLKYKKSKDIIDITDQCVFYPEDGTVLSGAEYEPKITAMYQTAAGDQYEAPISVLVNFNMVDIETIGEMIGESLGLEFTENLPDDFWDDFGMDEVPYIPDGDGYLLRQDDYSSIVDYLNAEGAFTDYMKYGDIPYMIVPAGTYRSKNGKNAIRATADIYLIATMMKKNGKPEKLPSPSCVDYPYTNIYAYNQIHVLTFTLNSSDYIQCKSGLKGGYNSATEGICRKMAGLALPDVEDERMFTDYVTFEDSSIVNIPKILSLPWCWYDDVPHDLEVLKTIVQNGTASSGCVGIIHAGKVPYLSYSEGSVYNEIKQQFPENFTDNVTYGDTEYVHVG